MFFSQFSKSVYGGESRLVYGHRITVSEDAVYIDGDKTDFTSLEEARQHIIENNTAKHLEEVITQESYEDISDNTIATLIKETHNIKVTDTIIDTYKDLASSNSFTIDPVVQELRKMNKLDRLVEGKIHYILEDNSTVAIDKRTQKNLNNLLEGHDEVISYMKQSKDNFLHALTLLGN